MEEVQDDILGHGIPETVFMKIISPQRFMYICEQ